MELIWVAWFFGGLIMGLVTCHLAYKGTEDDGTYKREYDRDHDSRVYHSGADRKHRSMDRYPDKKIAHIISMAEQLNVNIDTKEERVSERTIKEDEEILSGRL